jgi:hypothetical protein
MIKIISGYTDKGGSTTAFINLTNYFNSVGINCTLYGNQTWHLDKCQSGLIKDMVYNPDDIIIAHFINLPERPNVKKIVLACHEKWWFDFSKLRPFFDEAIFLHQEHRNFHSNYTGPYAIIPNIKEPLKSIEKGHLDLIAGVIGTIEDRKQTHTSILRAMKDKCTKIYLFGHIGDQQYFDMYVKPILNPRVEVFGHAGNKQSMYDMIGRVYHSSKGEVACLVKDECYLTNTKFFGNEETQNEVSKLTNDEIITAWVKVLGL